ncbi:hypothetical protein MKX01_039330 [Papaver californicum]|nr:hypothetical protein MKX01_039330 [Papaver californicum]
MFAIFTYIYCCITKKLQCTIFDFGNIYPETKPQSLSNEERSAAAPEYINADLLSCVLKKLGDLEEKVFTLQAKPAEMPSEKEELLNVVVCRVDALEAELIATKKALHEALMKQEELLAYIDGQKQAKLRKKKFFW